MTADLQIALMARAAVPGQAKTRPIPRLGKAGAARLHAELTHHVLDRIGRAGLPATLWCEPDMEHPFFRECAERHAITLRQQPSGDLGDRMLAIFEASRGPLLLMGSDCPAIDAGLLRDCANALAHRPAVFLPTADGGYGLVGLRAPIAGIFRDMPWGTDQVMAITRQRLSALEMDWVEVAEIWDVDVPADIDRLAATGFSIPLYED